MLFDFFILAFICYGMIHLDRQANCLFGLLDVGGEGIWAIDACKEKKLRAPFKYRVLTFWIARILKITSKKMHTIRIINGRTCDNVYCIDSTGSESYFVYKYILLFLANLSLYWYLSTMGLPSLLGCFIFNTLIALTYRDDKTDYLYESIFMSLFLTVLFSGANIFYLCLIVFLGALNRETAIFMPIIALFYLNVLSIALLGVFFAIGFSIPRYIYRAPIDVIDAGYYSGFRFLTFNPIRNWRKSIWPHLKKRYIGAIIDKLEIHYKGQQIVPLFSGQPLETYVKERFMHKFSVAIVFVIFMFLVLITGMKYSPVGHHYLLWISMLFIVCISIPADIREIRVYVPVFSILVQTLLYIS